MPSSSAQCTYIIGCMENGPVALESLIPLFIGAVLAFVKNISEDEYHIRTQQLFKVR